MKHEEHIHNYKKMLETTRRQRRQTVSRVAFVTHRWQFPQFQAVSK